MCDHDLRTAKAEVIQPITGGSALSADQVGILGAGIRVGAKWREQLVGSRHQHVAMMGNLQAA